MFATYNVLLLSKSLLYKIEDSARITHFFILFIHPWFYSKISSRIFYYFSFEESYFKREIIKKPINNLMKIVLQKN